MDEQANGWWCVEESFMISNEQELLVKTAARLLAANIKYYGNATRDDLQDSLRMAKELLEGAIKLAPNTTLP